MAACIGERIEVRPAGAELREGSMEAGSGIPGPSELRRTERGAEGRSDVARYKHRGDETG